MIVHAARAAKNRDSRGAVSRGFLEKLMWAGDTEALNRVAGCVCCCHEHTFSDCPARRWHGCHGQSNEQLTSTDVEAWAAFYERARGFTRSQFFGEEPETV